MWYELEYISQWTTYTLGPYDSVEACERDCEARYSAPGIQFRPDDDGTLKAVIYADEPVTLILYETDTPNAFIRH
jgi:hypothetical protein